MSIQFASRLNAKRYDLALGALVAALGLGLYVKTLAPTVEASDISEYQFVLSKLGLAHPTGYPLYVMLGHLWSYLPIGSVAYRLNLFSAVLAAATLCVLYLSLRRLTHYRGLALGLTLFFAVTPTFWSQALIAGTYILHALLFTLLLYAVIRYLQGELRLEWVLLIYGIGLTHHRTMILVAPALVYVIVSRRPENLNLRSGVKLLACGLAPLLLYLYLPVRGAQLNAPELTTIPGLSDYLLGKVFAYLLFQKGWAGLPGQIAQWWAWLLREFTLLGLLLAGIGLSIAFYCRRSLALFTLLTYLGFVAFNWNYYIGNIWVYYIATYILLVVWIMIGLDTGFQWVERWMSHPPQLAAGAKGLAVVALLGSVAWRSVALYPTLDLSQDYFYENLWLDALSLPLEPGSTVLANWDAHTPLVYYQRVEARRPDLRATITTDDNLRQALAAGQTVYAADLPATWKSYPVSVVGPLIEILPQPLDASHVLIPHPVEATFGDCLKLHGYDFRSMRRDAQGNERYLITAYWSRAGSANCAPAISIRLATETMDKFGQTDASLLRGWYGMERWGPEEIVVDSYTLRLPPSRQPLPEQVDLSLLVYQPEDGTAWPVMETGQELLELGPVRLK